MSAIGRWLCAHGWHVWIYQPAHRRHCARCPVAQWQVEYWDGSTEWL